MMKNIPKLYGACYVVDMGLDPLKHFLNVYVAGYVWLDSFEGVVVPPRYVIKDADKFLNNQF